MAISTEDTIMSALKTGLETISIANGYQTDISRIFEEPAVLPDVMDRPSICFYSDRDDRKNFAYGYSERLLHIWLLGYVDCPNGNWEPIRKLKADIIALLESSTNWTYQEFTEIVGFVQAFLGVEKSIGIVQGEINISYQHAFASP